MTGGRPESMRATGRSRDPVTGTTRGPQSESVGLAIMALAATVFTLIALGVTSVAFAARLPAVAGLVGWCQRTAADVPWWVGAAASVSLLSMVIGALVTSWRHLRARPAKGAAPVAVVRAPELFAYSMGGRRGQVVVSSGLLGRLDPAERRVLFAHETAHLRLGHHRLLWAADIAALNPLLRPLCSRLRFSIERAADEEAVRAVGDRPLVAKTVGRVALMAFEAAPGPALGMDGGAVVTRVEALLVPAPPARPNRAVASGLVVLTLAAALTWVQWPQLSELALHLCRI